MFVEHPEYRDILVNLDTHRLILSNDGANDYTYDFHDKTWCGTEVEMCFELFPDDSKSREVIDPKKIKEDYIKKYCQFDESLNKYVYSYIDPHYLREKIKSLVLDALEKGDVILLKYLNDKYPLIKYKETIPIIIYSNFSLELVKYLREEIKVVWNNDFLENCKDFRVLKYALQNGCKCVEWKLKMILYNFREEIEKDEWMKELYEKLNFH